MLLSFNELLQILFMLGLQILMLIISVFIKPYGETKSLNFVVRAMFFCLAGTCIASLLDLLTSINIIYLILPWWTTALIFSLIVLIKISSRNSGLSQSERKKNSRGKNTFDKKNIKPNV